MRGQVFAPRRTSKEGSSKRQKGVRPSLQVKQKGVKQKGVRSSSWHFSVVPPASGTKEVRAVTLNYLTCVASCARGSAIEAASGIAVRFGCSVVTLERRCDSGRRACVRGGRRVMLPKRRHDRLHVETQQIEAAVDRDSKVLVLRPADIAIAFGDELRHA
jgi:hypothetical protein